jgi:hypothetical protein
MVRAIGTFWPWPGVARPWPGVPWPGVARPGVARPGVPWPGVPRPGVPWPGQEPRAKGQEFTQANCKIFFKFILYFLLEVDYDYGYISKNG